MKNKRALIVLTALLFSMTVSCSAQSSNALIGKWFFEDFNGYLSLIEFTRTQMLIRNLEDDDDDTETMSYQADSATITADGETMRYTIQNGNVLTLTTPDGEKYIGKKLQSNVTALSGKYELVNDAGLIETLEFTNKSTVRGTADALGMGTARFTAKYKISGSQVELSESSGGYGTIYLEIIGDSILKGNTFGGFGDDSIFVKR
ncbi:MAG: hypothetical protein LBH20_09755 [Treponema sp.]|jgi:hypothetical protein|nr:hypothetical protein [Treponema sp.]